MKKLYHLPPDHSSKGHKIVFDLIRSMFSGNVIYNEYSYAKILNSSYKKDDVQNSVLLKRSNRLHADIYDKTLKIIYEVNGIQHYEPVMFSKKESIQKIMGRFESQKGIDRLKREIAKEARVRIFEIPYDKINKIDKNYIWDLLSEK